MRKSYTIYENSSKRVVAFKEITNLSGNRQDEQSAKESILLNLNKRIAKSILPSTTIKHVCISELPQYLKSETFNSDVRSVCIN